MRILSANGSLGLSNPDTEGTSLPRPTWNIETCDDAISRSRCDRLAAFLSTGIGRSLRANGYPSMQWPGDDSCLIPALRESRKPEGAVPCDPSLRITAVVPRKGRTRSQPAVLGTAEKGRGARVVPMNHDRVATIIARHVQQNKSKAQILCDLVSRMPLSLRSLRKVRTIRG